MAFLLNIVSWLLGSKIGRYVAWSAIAAAFVLYILYTVRKSGYEAKEAEQTKKLLKDLMEKVKVDRDLSKMSSAERRRHLMRWSRSVSDNNK